MNGPEHYREAERLEGEFVRMVADPDFKQKAEEAGIGVAAFPGLLLAQAQVHATLALAAATAADQGIPRVRFGWAEATA